MIRQAELEYDEDSEDQSVS